MDLLKRYLLFGGQVYYPSGGFDDLLGSFGTIDEARMAERATPRTSYRGDWWWTIVDGTTGEQVDGGGDDFRSGAS